MPKILKQNIYNSGVKKFAKFPEFLRKNFVLISIFSIIIFCCGRTNTDAAINQKINYQGKLTDSAGVAVADGAYDFVFKLYTAGGGGSAIWTESWTNSVLFTDSGTDYTAGGCASGIDKVAYTSGTNEASLAAGQLLWNTTKKESAVIESVVTASNYICVYSTPSTWTDGDGITNRIYVKNGLFSVMLGGVQALDAVNFNQLVYLGVKVGSDSEMKPRKMIGAVPGAFESKQLGGYTWEVPGTIGLTTPNSGAFTTLSSAYNGVLTALTVNQSGGGFLADIQKSGTSKFMIDNAGNIGIGTTAPGYKLDIQNGGSIAAGEQSISWFGRTGTSEPGIIIGYQANGSAAAYGRIRSGGSNTLGLALGGSGSSIDSIFIKNDGNVGIGTTGPAYALDVVGNMRSSSYGIFGGHVVGNGQYGLYNGNLNNGYIGFPSAGNIAIMNGNVGIGTTAPSQKLDVQGNIAIASNYLGGGLGYGNGGSPASYATLQMYNGSSGYTVLNNQNYGISLQTAGTDKVTILNAGNVGIGTTSPSQKLEIAGNIKASGYGNLGSLQINGSEIIGSDLVLNNYIQDIRYDDGNVTFNNYQPNYLWNALDKGFTATWNDLTGISNPSYVWYPDTTEHYTTLDMSQTADPLTITLEGTMPTTTNVSDIRIFFQWHGAAAYNTVSFEVKRNDDVWVSVPADFTTDQGLVFSKTLHSYAPYPTYTAWKGVRVVLTTKSVSSGNRYIYGVGLYTPRDFYNSYALYKKGDIMYGTLSSQLLQPRTDNTYDIGSTTNRYKNLYLSGNVGIGTTAPENSDGWQRVLDVSGAANSKIIATSSGVQIGLYAHDSGFFGAPAGGIVGTRTNNALSFITNAVTRMAIDSSGNVGIGTTAPGAKLEVSRTLANNDWNALTISNKGSWTTAANKYAQMLFTDGTNNVAGIGATFDGTYGRLDFNALYNGGSGLTSAVAMSIRGNGNVGIGTTVPTAKLHLAAGTATASTAPLKFTSGTNLTAPEAGAMEFDGTNLYFTPAAARKTIAFLDSTFTGTWNGGVITPAYGGTGIANNAANTITFTGNYSLGLTLSGATSVTLPTSGTLLTNSLTSAYLFVGNGSNVATGVALSGDATISNAGVLTIANNSVDGTDIALGSDAQGDIMYYNGTDWARLGAGTSGQFLKTQGAGANPTWAADNNAGGTVTSVGLSMPAQFTVTNSPVTTSGTLTAAWASQTANYVLAAPNGSAGTPTFRALVDADIPDTVTLTNITQITNRDHGSLSGLTDDDHTIYALLAGRSGGQTITGGTAATDDLILKTTSGTGASGADMIFQTGTNGGTEAMRILYNGNIGIGTAAPGSYKLYVSGNTYLNGTVTGVTSVSSPTFQGISAAVTFGNASYATTIAGSGLTVSPTAWTATPTISGLITATSGLTANGALTANSTFTLGDNGDTGSVNTSDWDISTTGAMTGISGITNDGAYTQSGTSANTFTGTSTFSNATYSALFTGGNVGIGTATPGQLLEISAVKDAAIRIESTKDGSDWTNSDTIGAIEFYGSDGSGVGAGVKTSIKSIQENGTYGNEFGLAFATGGVTGEGNNIERLRITSDGYIGIGMTAPNEKFEIYNGNERIDYGHLKFYGLSAPGASSGAAVSGTGLEVGDYYYRVTFVTANGETALGTASAVITTSAGNQQIDLSGIPTGTSGVVTQRKIYRTKVNSSTNYYLLTTVADNTTTTYSDTTADASLGNNYTYKGNTTAGKTFIDGSLTSYVGGNIAAFGTNALANSLDTAWANAAFGYGAATYLNTGSNNTAMGYYALRYNETGSSNVAIGRDAGFGVSGNSYSGSTLVGYRAGYSTTTGGNNTSVGYYSGYSNASGSTNTMLGYYSGYGLLSGSNNILIGQQAGRNLTTGSNNIVIGVNVYTPAVDSANTLNIGNLVFGTGLDGSGSTLSTGNIGVGIVSPSSKLHISGTSSDSIGSGAGNLAVQGSGGNGLLVGTVATSPYPTYIQSGYISDLATHPYGLILNPLGGNVGIGTTAPTSYTLQVAGTAGASTSVNSPIFQGQAAAVTFGNASYATTIAGSGLTVSPTAWTATPTISGLITATSGLTANGTLTANGQVILGDGGDDIAINSNDWDISSAGAISSITTIGMSGQLTSTLATGTSPFAVTSTTVNTNLNADLLDGQHAAAFLTANQTITLSGDVTGSGTTAITTTIADNSVDGTDIALGSDAQGDIMYYNGTDWARLGAGTSGQFLKTQGAGANPTWAADNNTTDHGSLSGLTDDDHTIYALLAGRSGGQTITGGTAATDDLILKTTSGTGASGADMIFQTGTNGGTEAMRILYDGKIGIGTAVPGRKLDVSGDVNIGTTLYVDTIQLTGTCCGVGINFNNENMAGLNAITISDSGAGEGIQWADAAWSIDNSPLDRSNAVGNLNFYGTSYNIALWRPQLWVYNASNYTTATAQSDGGLNFTTTGTGNITFNQGGNVGIGTTAPGEVLDVNGNIKTRGDFLKSTFVDGSPNNLVKNGGFELGTPGWNAALATISQQADGYFGAYSLKVVYSGSGDNYISQVLPTISQTLANRSYTFSFYAKADSAGTLTNAPYLQTTGGSYNANCTISDTALTTSWKKFTATCTWGAGITNTDWRIILRTSGDIANAVYYDGVQVQNGTSGTEFSNFAVDDNGNAVFEGNVGIGTTAPAYKLDVNGDASLGYSGGGVDRTLWIFGSGSSGAARQYIKTEGLNSIWHSGYGSFIMEPAGDLMIKPWDGAAYTERFRITSAGNVGIGTTVPTAKLHLAAGTATASTAPLKFTSGTNLTNPEAGAMEFDGTNLYFTPAAARKTIAFLDSTFTGTWNGGVITPAKGGTGVANGANNTITFTGNYTLGLTLSNNTSVTLPTSGTLATLAGAESLTNKKLGSLTTNGFVKTSGSDGTLSVDTNTYITGNQTITLSGDVTGSGTTAITTTIADNSVDGTDIALGSDAQGDIMYYNGTDWARLGASTSGYVLKTQGAAANPIWAAESDPVVKAINGMVKSNGSTISAATAGTDYSAGTSALATGILKSTTTTGALSIAAAGDLNTTFGSQTANYVYAAPNGGGGNPSFRALVDADIPDTITITNLTQIGTRDHGSLTGLTDDDHSIYALLAGRSGGQTLIGGTAATDDLILKTTSGTGASGADMIFQTGNNGATEAMRILYDGKIGIGTAAPTAILNVFTETDRTDESAGIPFRLGSTTTGKMQMYFGVNDANNYTYIGSVETGTDYRNLVLQPNGGNVGIGTAAPGQKLDVYGWGRFEGVSGANRGDSGAIEFYNDGASSKNVQAQIKGLRGIGDYKAGQLGFFTAAPSTGTLNEWMTITENGNVGIGTTNPNQKLDVGGKILSEATSASLTTGILLDATAATNGYTTTVGEDDTGSYIYNNSTVRKLSLGVNSSRTNFVIDTTGNVGIGTTSPQRRLHLSGDTYTTIKLDGTTGGQIAFATAGVDKSYLYSNSAGLNFYSEGDRVTFLNTGNVGIGTTNPGQQLEVTKNILLPPAVTNTNGNLFLGGDTSAGVNGLRLFSLDDGGAGGYIDVKASASTKGLSIRVDTSAGGAERMRINADGNVGLGTATPGEALEVNGNIKTTNDRALPHLVLDSSSSGDNWTSQGAYISIGEGGALGSASMHLTYTGDGYGYSGAGTVTSGIPAGGYWRYAYNSQNIYTPANVGIGITAPAYKLDVDNGFFHQTYNTTSVPASSNSGGLAMSWNRSGGAAEVNLYNVYNNASTAFQFSQKTGSSTYTDLMTILGSGDIGIGITVPSSLLDLQKAGTAKAITDIMEITNSGNAADMDGTGGGILFNQYYYNATTPAVADAARISTFTETDWTSTASTQDASLVFQTALDGTLAEKVRISASGYLGVGTASPQFKLDVAGRISTSGGDGAGYNAFNVGTSESGNYEMWREVWSSNVYYMQSLAGGTGTARDVTYVDNVGYSWLYFKQGGKVGINDTTAVGSANLPAGSLVLGSGALCVDDGGTNCDDASRTAGRIYAESLSITTIDLAENYPVLDQAIEGGDLIAADTQINKLCVETADAQDGSKVCSRRENGNVPFVAKADGTKTILGVVSTEPGITLGGWRNEELMDYKKVPVALSGRIPVKVNLEGGAIKVGDKIALSSVAGVGRKASAGDDQTIGIALESYDSEGMGKILVFVNLESSGDAQLEEMKLKLSEAGLLESDHFSVSASSSEEFVENHPGFVEIIRQVLAKLGVAIRDGVASLKEVVADRFTAQTVHMEQIEMVDKSTGSVYCTWIENGDWRKVKGRCDSALMGMDFGNESLIPDSGGGEAGQEDGTATNAADAPANDPSQTTADGDAASSNGADNSTSAESGSTSSDAPANDSTSAADVIIDSSDFVESVSEVGTSGASSASIADEADSGADQSSSGSSSPGAANTSSNTTDTADTDAGN